MLISLTIINLTEQNVYFHLFRTKADRLAYCPTSFELNQSHVTLIEPLGPNPNETHKVQSKIIKGGLIKSSDKMIEHHLHKSYFTA